MLTIPKLLLRWLSCFLFVFTPSALSAAIIYVNHAAAGANNGTTWADAFTNLTDALSAAGNGDEIWVAQGVYKPVSLLDLDASGGIDAREATFQIPDGVAVYGGFSGIETNLDERNWTTHVTILSGDIDNNDLNLDGNAIAENTGQIVGNNAYHVLYTNNVAASTQVNGFTITAGHASGVVPVTNPNRFGGGWYNNFNGAINSSSPTISNNIFQGNFALAEGGALYNKNGTVGAAVQSQISNCKFLFNKTDFAGGAIGLGSFSAGNYAPIISNCEFRENEAFRRGGAIYFVGDHAILNDCIFISNRVTAISMGETLPGSGGGVAMTGSNAQFSRCYFTGNSATGNPTGPFEGGGGGAVYMSTNEPQSTTLGISAPKFTSCGFYSNIASGNTAAWGGAAVHLSDAGKLRPSYVNCVFAGNQAQNDGGAVADFARVIGVADGFVPELTPVFTNCTFTGNQASQRGGAIFNDGFIFMASEVLQSRIENSILWNNSAAMEGPEVFNTGNNVVAYSLIEGSGGSGVGWNAAIGTDAGNNLDESPAFFNDADPDGIDNIPANNDDGLELSPASPAINVGNNAAAGLAGITTDYTSDPRILGAIVDMGAYERAGIVIPDLDIYWLEDWLDKKPPCFICPWAFLLRDKLFYQFIWDGPAQLIVNEKMAVIKGRIIHTQNKKLSFDVFLKLVNPHDWETWSSKGRTYSAFTWEAIQLAQKTHTNWTYWELSNESYLQGRVDLSGKLSLSHLPNNYKTGFQLGKAANGWDKDMGMSGSFNYNGTIVHKGKKLQLKGNGSMNVDAIKCTEKCEPLNNQVEMKLARAPEELKDKNAILVFPVPARDQLTVESDNIIAEKYITKLYNGAGQLKKTIIVQGKNGKLELPVRDLEPGVYLLQIISPSGETMSKKFIKE